MSTVMDDRSERGSRKRGQQHEEEEHPRKSPRLSDSTFFPTENGRDEPSHRPVTKHTRKERKQNRSTRIHSLRKLLARGTLPSTVQQEKERELAALIHEQDRTKSRKEAKRTLERYHYVRFVERQKAEKRLKRLRKERASVRNSLEVDKKIHEMEVNRCYAIYHPLDQKYVSIFASSTDAKEEEREEEDDDDQDPSEEKGNEKPSMWYKVEAAMARGEKYLQALRTGKSDTSAQHIAVHPDREANFVKDNGGSKSTRSQPLLKQPKNKANLLNSETIATSEKSDGEDQSDGGFFDR